MQECKTIRDKYISDKKKFLRQRNFRTEEVKYEIMMHILGTHIKIRKKLNQVHEITAGLRL